MSTESAIREKGPGAAPAGREAPPVPMTLDGASILHQMFRVRWQEWKRLSGPEQDELADEAAPVLQEAENDPEGGSALFSQLGHKGDLMLVHFRKSFEALSEVELRLARLGLSNYLEPAGSYVSVVELGLYESSVQLFNALLEKGVEPGSPEWIAAEEEKAREQAEAMAPRLWPRVPPHRYLCFYPMDKKRGEQKNWYTLPIAERRRMMRDHGLIGRKYAGKVKQIISGSIGFDDWEWGVDLFADDPLVFKKLIYEMRFDEASADYALFGSFYISLRFSAQDLGKYLRGEAPSYQPPPQG